MPTRTMEPTKQPKAPKPLNRSKLSERYNARAERMSDTKLTRRSAQATKAAGRTALRSATTSNPRVSRRADRRALKADVYGRALSRRPTVSIA